MKKILLIALIGTGFAIKAQEKIQTEIGPKDDFVYKNGNIGIGTNDPINKLQVAGSIRSENFIVKGTNSSTWLYDRDIINRASDAFRMEKKEGTLNFYDRTYLGGFSDLNFFKHTFYNSASSTLFLNPKTNLIFQINESEVMRINPDGNIGIGTTNPLSKLSVDGQIRATEVKVLIDISVPDYVFESDYELRTLKETKKYINENKHLPEIPSAAEIGENGIDLGNMNMLLLKKIEELTLHQIKLMEEIEVMKKEMKK